MEIYGFESCWWVPADTDLVMEAESVASLYWPNFILEYDEDYYQEPPNFLIYRNNKVKVRVHEEGATRDLVKSIFAFYINGYPRQKWCSITIVSDEPKGEIQKILDTLKDNMNAIDAQAGEQLDPCS